MEGYERGPLLRRVSRIDALSRDHKLDVRAHQRTYDGSYTRAAIGCLSFSILVIKLFSKEFLLIGTIYTIYGSILYFMGVLNSRHVHRYYDYRNHMDYFVTSGNSVLLLTVISLISYITLFVLIWQIDAK